MHNIITWFEIPVTDINRAIQFYNNIFNITIQSSEMMGNKMGFFPSDDKNISGALVEGDSYTPSEKGNLIYFNAENELDVILERIDKNNGIILLPKTLISPEIGYFALFVDTEGNKLALHSSK